MTPLLIAALIIVASLALWILGRCAAKYTARDERARLHREAFYGMSRRLVGDDRVPDDVATFIVWMAESLCDPRLLRRFAWHLLFNHGKVDQSPLSGSLAKMDDPMRAVFAKMMMAFALAITFNNFFLGVVFRRAFWVESRKPPKSLDDNRVQAFTSDLASAQAA